MTTSLDPALTPRDDERSHMATLIDGKAYAADLREQVTADVKALRSSQGITPGLAVVRVGDDPASEVYVRNKAKACQLAGITSFEHHLPADISEDTLLTKIAGLNADDNIHGILVQLPLPRHIDANAIIQAIDPKKDVDGFHAINSGRLLNGQEGLVPCTPQGCLMLIQDQLGEDLSGKHAVVIGRSNIVGKPMTILLLQQHATVTLCHSRTEDLPEMVRRADIVVAAVGKPQLVKGDWIKPGAVVIDVGINRVAGEDGKMQLVGDVDFDAARAHAAAITPVPGGVGPMTIACLLKNTVKAASST